MSGFPIPDGEPPAGRVRLLLAAATAAGAHFGLGALLLAVASSGGSGRPQSGSAPSPRAIAIELQGAAIGEPAITATPVIPEVMSGVRPAERFLADAVSAPVPGIRPTEITNPGPDPVETTTATAMPEAVALPPAPPAELPEAPAPTVAVKAVEPRSMGAVPPPPRKPARAGPERPPQPIAPQPSTGAEAVATAAPAPAASPGLPDAAPPNTSRRAMASTQSAAAGTPAPASPGGGTGLAEDYLASLRAWLEAHKRYPRAARLRRQEGIVLLSFVMDPKGNLLSYEIRRSSGHAALDGAVRDMIVRAAPLPEAPASLAQAKLRLAVPIAFRLTP